MRCGTSYALRDTERRRSEATHGVTAFWYHAKRPGCLFTPVAERVFHLVRNFAVFRRSVYTDWRFVFPGTLPVSMGRVKPNEKDARSA